MNPQINRRFDLYDPVKHTGRTPIQLDCCPFNLVEVFHWERLEGGRYGESPAWKAADYELCFVEHENGTGQLLQPLRYPVTVW